MSTSAPAAIREGEGEGGHAERWVGLSIILIGTLIIALDSTIVNIALPQIAKALGAGQNIQWVVTANLLANAVAMTASAWLSDRVGAKRLFLSAMALFAIASLGAAFAPNLGLLIAARAAQGCCAGILNPVSMSIMLDLFPVHERGRAMGIWGLVAMSAPAVGPTIGGLLVTAVSWHWLFLPSVPIGLAGALIGQRKLADTGRRTAAPLDWTGLLLGASGLSAFLFGLSQSRAWGWASPGVAGSLVVAAVLLGAFVLQALHTRHPVLDLRLVGRPIYRPAVIIVALVTAPQFARSVFMPLQLDTLRDYSTLKIGIILTPAAAATALSMAIGGRLHDRHGVRGPTMAGCLLMLIGVLANAFLTTTSSALYIAAVMTVQGLGVGIVMIPVTVAAMNSVPDDKMAQASTMRALTNQVAAAISVASMFALVNARLSAATSIAERQGAYNSAMQAGAVVLVVALAVASRLPKR